MARASESRDERRTRRDSEVPYTLEEEAPKALSALDQAAFWGNLGVSLLGFGGALAVLAPSGVPRLSLLAAGAAAIVGTVLGTLALSLSTIPGAQTGAPAMVLLRGLFGARASYVPTILNILQLLGWGTFELVVIAQGFEALLGDAAPRWAYVVAGGVVTTALTIWPLGAVRVLRRYVTAAVVIAMIYFYVQIFRHPLPDLTRGSWQGFWAGADAALAVAVSWVPLSSDYSRHSHTPGRAFFGSFVGYSLTQIGTYVLGLVALVLVSANPDRIFGAFLAVPLGWLFFAVLVIREVDQSFANVYSTAVSVQNLRPLTDRRVLSVAVGVLTTLFALTLDISRYASFLYLLGSVFVPMLAVLVVDYFVVTGRSRWDLSQRARSRPMMLVPWVLGFVMYQLVNPGGIGLWAGAWKAVRDWLGFHPGPWMSASISSFVVAALA
ncbi:MAG: purine-cytosine permease family protein, partial [Streptosporangiaceae bacterium]